MIYPIPTEDLFSLSIFLLCIVASAFFSASETAVTSLGVLKTKHLIDAKGKSVEILNFWLKYPGRVLTTILIFNTLVNILASAIMTQLAIKYYDNAVGFATGLVTFIVLIFGEIIPKSFARSAPEVMAPAAMRIIKVFYTIFYPIVYVLSEFADFVIRSMGSNQKFTPTITQEELEFIINEGSSNGVIEDLKKDMLSGVFEFDETRVSEIMTPRPDVIAIPKTASVADAVRLTIESGHSRIPVYDERIDNIVGILFAKDLLRHHATKGDSAVKLTNLMREPFFTPESKLIMEVFKDLKRAKNHLTVIIDEYGGMAGIVTMEDILEEIVGEIQDEFDTEEAEIIDLGNGIFELSGTYGIDDFKERFGLNSSPSEEEPEDIETVAGWIIQKLGEMPKVGQSITLGTITIEVTEVERHRISKLRVVQDLTAENNTTNGEGTNGN